MIKEISKMIKNFFDILFSKKRNPSFVEIKKQKAKARQNKWNDPFFAMARISRLKGEDREIAIAKYRSMANGKKINPINCR